MEKGSDSEGMMGVCSGKMRGVERMNIVWVSGGLEMVHNKEIGVADVGDKGQ